MDDYGCSLLVNFSRCYVPQWNFHGIHSPARLFSLDLLFPCAVCMVFAGLPFRALRTRICSTARFFRYGVFFPPRQQWSDWQWSDWQTSSYGENDWRPPYGRWGAGQQTCWVQKCQGGICGIHQEISRLSKDTLEDVRNEFDCSHLHHFTVIQKYSCQFRCCAAPMLLHVNGTDGMTTIGHQQMMAKKS